MFDFLLSTSRKSQFKNDVMCNMYQPSINYESVKSKFVNDHSRITSSNVLFLKYSKFQDLANCSLVLKNLNEHS
jgi:hypothetical protein